MKVICTLAALAAIVIPASTATAGSAAGWRPVVVAADGDKSEYGGGVDMSLGTTALNLRGLRLVARTDLPLKTSVRVYCNRGDTRTDKSIRLQLRSGVTALPVPIVGGRCTIDVDAYNFDPGTAEVRLEAR